MAFIMDNWYDWKWQLKNRIKTIDELSKYIELTEKEKQTINNGLEYPFCINRYYLSLIDKDNLNCAVRKQVIPYSNESISSNETGQPHKKKLRLDSIYKKSEIR